MTQRPLLTDFSAGEVSRKFYGRFDLEVYGRGLARLENWIPFTQGLLTTRPPTKYLGESYGNVQARYIPFVVGATAFEVELTPLAIRIWLGDALAPVVGSLNPIVTTYAAADIPFIQYQKVANQLFLVCRGYPIKVLSWLGMLTMQYQFSFEDLTIGFGTGVDDWAAAHAYAVDDVVIAGSAPKRAYKCITAGTSGSVAPTTEDEDVTDGSVHWSHEFTQPFSQDGDYPGAVAYFNGRMAFAGTTYQPDGVWLSEPYDFGSFNFFSMVTSTGVGIVDAADWEDPNTPETYTYSEKRSVIGEGHAIFAQLGSENDESVMWLSATDAMVIGTGTSEWVATKDLTALNVDKCIHLKSRLGSSEQQAMVLGTNPVFLQGTLTKAFLWEYSYKGEDNELQSVDLTYLSDHMLSAGVSQMDFAQMPVPLWLGVSDGKLACLLYSRKYQVAAWFWIVTDGIVLSVCVIPGTTDDAIYLQVLRNSRYCFERLEGILETGNQMLDSYVQVTGAGATVTGLDRFDGETVAIYNATDGTWHSATVAAGSLTTPAECVAHALWIGLRYTCSIQSLPLQTQVSATGATGQAKLKRVVAVSARVLDSFPFKVGYSQTLNLEAARTAGDLPWTAAYSGDVRIPFQGSWSTEGYLWIIQDLPQPSTILALLPEVDA